MGMFSREYLEKTGGLEDLSGGPIAVHTEYLHLIKTGLLEKIAYIDAPLVIYRVHKGSSGWSRSLQADLEFAKHAGENLFRRSIEFLRGSELIELFDQNLTRLLQRIMVEFIDMAKSKPAHSFNCRQLLKYLIFSRRYVSSLKGSPLYWRAIKCLGKVEAGIFW